MNWKQIDLYKPAILYQPRTYYQIKCLAAELGGEPKPPKYKPVRYLPPRIIDLRGIKLTNKQNE